MMSNSENRRSPPPPDGGRPRRPAGSASRDLIGDDSTKPSAIHDGLAARKQPTDRRWTPTPGHRGTSRSSQPWWTALLVYDGGARSASVILGRSQSGQAIVITCCTPSSCGQRSTQRCCAAPNDAEPTPPEGDTGREQRGEIIAVKPFAEMVVWRRWPAACRRRCRPPRPLLALPAAYYLPGTVRADRGARGAVLGAARGYAKY